MKRLLAVLVLALLAVAAALLWLQRDMQRFLDTPMAVPPSAVLVVEPGTGLRSLARQLQERGWLDRPHYLLLEARRTGSARRIKAGEFAIPPGTTPRALLEILVGGRVVQYALTLVEGWTFAQMMEAVRGSPHLVQTLGHATPARVMAAIGRAGHFPEGRFLPETYHFPAGTRDTGFLERANAGLEKVLAEEWAARQPGLPYESAYQALVVASLVEKETAVAEERPRIAGVFVRRLQKGMKLQTDPTVIYALGEGFDGNIRRADLDVDSPYNTYRYAGLPPTPIALAGRAAIHAALNPAPGNELYFVARGDGSHEFSATLDAHNAAVRRYQLQGR